MTDAADDPRDDTRFHLLTALLDACEESGLDLDAQLRALTIVWVERARRLRGEALALPGTYATEKSRQLETLAEMTVTVADDQPDLEAERLYQGGRHHRSVGTYEAKAGAAMMDGGPLSAILRTTRARP